MATSRSVRRPAAPQPAYVLQRHDWSESSLIVELFTRGLGRVVTVARGAKKPTSNYRPLLLPFQPVMVMLGAPPKAAEDGADRELLPLRSAEWAGGQPLVRGAALFSAFYLNELLLKGLARQDPHEALFDAYAAALAALASLPTARDEPAVLRAFELVLLRETGLLPDLSVATLTAEPLAEDGSYALDATHGLVAAVQGPSGARWVALEAALGVAQGARRFEALRSTCQGVAGSLRRPLQGLLHYHLGHTPMRTREVWQGVQTLLPT
ncbi:MAG: DNA repair protein RecO [Rubrivivax sp.]|nr:DNA repair protein RecO [Rubrivivax sp.]